MLLVLPKLLKVHSPVPVKRNAQVFVNQKRSCASFENKLELSDSPSKKIEACLCNFMYILLLEIKLLKIFYSMYVYMSVMCWSF